jgi:hypothetical protein
VFKCFSLILVPARPVIIMEFGKSDIKSDLQKDEQPEAPAPSAPTPTWPPVADVLSRAGVVSALAVNAVNLLRALPNSAHLRAPLISALLHGVSADCAAQIACVSRPLVYSARSRFPAGELGDLAAQYPANTHREAVAAEELASIRAVIRENLLVGGDSLRHLLTNDKLYQRYLASYNESLCELVKVHRAHQTPDDTAAEPALRTLLMKFGEHETQLAFLAWARSTSSAAMAGGHRPGPIDEALEYLEQTASTPPLPRSRGVFEHVLHDLSVVRPHHDYGQWDCTHCAQGPEAMARLRDLARLPLPLTDAQAEDLDAAEAAVQQFQEHTAVVHAQTDAAEEALADLDAAHAVCTWDFAQVDVQANVGHRATSRFHVLIAIIKRGNSNPVYCDFLVQDVKTQKPDLFFVREVLLYLADKTPFFSGLTLLTFLSDTCAGEFRSCFAFAQMAALQQRIGVRIRLLFKAARHGKGSADAHKGHLSRIITRRLKEVTLARQQQPGSAAQLLSTFPDAESLALFLRHAFTTIESHCFVLPTVHRDPSLKADVRTVPGTMQMHDVQFDGADVLRSKHLSSDQHADLVHLHFRRPYSLDGACSPYDCCEHF